MIDQISMKFVV